MSTAVADDNWNSLVVCRELPEPEELDGPPAARDPSARTRCVPYEGVCATSPVGRTYMGREKLDLFNHVSEDLTLDGKRQLCLDLCQESRGLACEFVAQAGLEYDGCFVFRSLVDHGIEPTSADGGDTGRVARESETSIPIDAARSRELENRDFTKWDGE